MKKISQTPVLIILFFVWVVFGCSATAGSMADDRGRSNPAMHKKITFQMIIKFRDSVADPSQPEFVSELSGEAGAKMSYFRPMSGGAHVFRLETGSDKAEIQKVLEKLSHRSDVLYVELDEKMKHQSIDRLNH